MSEGKEKIGNEKTASEIKEALNKEPIQNNEGSNESVLYSNMITIGEIITSNKLFECWIKGRFPENFDNLLYKYLEVKVRLLKNEEFEIKDLNRWLGQVLFAVEVGMKRDKKKFSYFYNFFKSLLGDKRWRIII